MGKVRRGGYVFVTWKGDHAPRHVHVYRDGKPVVAMKGEASRKVLDLIDELKCEGLL